MKVKTLNAEQYVQLCRQQQNQKTNSKIPYDKIILLEDVRLPSDIEELPGILTEFENLDARHSKLRYFNHIIRKDADFKGVRTLKEFGRDAKFGSDLDCRETSLV